MTPSYSYISDLMMSDRRMGDVKPSVDCKAELLRAMPGGVASPCKLGMRKRWCWSEEAAQVRAGHPWGMQPAVHLQPLISVARPSVRPLANKATCVT